MVLRTVLTLALNATFDTCRGCAKRPMSEQRRAGTFEDIRVERSCHSVGIFRPSRISSYLLTWVRVPPPPTRGESDRKLASVEYEEWHALLCVTRPHLYHVSGRAFGAVRKPRWHVHFHPRPARSDTPKERWIRGQCSSF